MNQNQHAGQQQYIQAIEPHEWTALTAQWGAAPQRHYRLMVEHPFLTGEHQMLISDRRRAEICYVMHRSDPADGLLLHLKRFYPSTAYRLPTGGIHQDESVFATLVREIHEETGLTVNAGSAQEDGADAANFVRVERFLGTTAYEFVHPQLGTSNFATYHFLVRSAPNAVLDPQDADEQIVGWQWRPAVELAATAELLAHVGATAPDWADWGRFRALSHAFVAEQLSAPLGPVAQ